MSRRRVTLGSGVVAVLLAAILAVLLAGPDDAAGLVPSAATPLSAHRDSLAAAAPAGEASAAPPQRIERPAWARASVATVWLRPAKARPVDRPALRRAPDINRWVHRQTLAEREGLTHRVLTQAVHGERVDVLRERSGWSRVRLPQQRGSYFRDGIVGWVPTRQLTARAPRTAHARPGAAVHRHRGSPLAVARHYLGVRYLWGGMTRRGIDCSGLTYQVFGALGRTLPRDAADQSRVGRPVSRAQLRPGDLVFFGPGGWRTIHHVGIYAGGGVVLHAPHTGSTVQLTPLTDWSDYWGARRVL